MKITKRQLRRLINEAYLPGDAYDYDNMPDEGWGPDNLEQQLYTADARKGFKPDINKMNKLKDTKFEMNTLNQFVKDFFDDSKPEFDSKQLVLKILNMKQAADQGIGYDENQKKDIEKALELAEEATGFVASDSYLTQAGEEHFGKDGRDPYIEKSAHFRRQGISENSKSLNRRQLRRLILKEFKMSSDSNLPTIDINDIISGGTGFPPPPDIPDGHGRGGGGGGSNCEDPMGGDGRFDDAYNRTLDAFDDYLMMTGLDPFSYIERLKAMGVSGLEDVTGKALMDFLSDELLFEIAMALCKQQIIDEMLPVAFNNPARFL